MALHQPYTQTYPLQETFSKKLILYDLYVFVPMGTSI